MNEKSVSKQSVSASASRARLAARSLSKNDEIYRSKRKRDVSIKTAVNSDCQSNIALSPEILNRNYEGVYPARPFDAGNNTSARCCKRTLKQELEHTGDRGWQLRDRMDYFNLNNFRFQQSTLYPFANLPRDFFRIETVGYDEIKCHR